MLNIHKRYCTETFDAQGNLTSFRVNCGSHFNYAYDVIDEIGRVEPERMAMIWRNPEGEEHDLRFSDISRWSNKVANYFLSQGIRKGDRVMVILRRHYSFWIVSLALTKIGAVVIPATFMLKEHDVSYRIEAAGLTAIVVNSVGTIAEEVDKACAKLGRDLPRFLINGAQPDLPNSDTAAYDYGLWGSALSGEQGLFGAPCRREGWRDLASGVREAPDMLDHVFARNIGVFNRIVQQGCGDRLRIHVKVR